MYRSHGLAVLALAATIACTDSTGARTSGASWMVDTVPLLVLGSVRDDTSQFFSTVVGATRLPSGDVLVADRQEHALQLFGTDGVRKRSVGRKGSGPGEFTYPAKFWRCGDSVFVYDIEGSRTSVWSLQLEYVRSFRFHAGAQVGGSTPYASSCNRAGTFAHYGWEDMRNLDVDGRVLRLRVPFWIGGPDSSLRLLVDSFPGSERVLSIDRGSGRITGSGPRMFGKQTSIALGSDRLYIGTAERPEVLAMNLQSLAVDTIRLPWQEAPLTAEDIAARKAVEIAASSPGRRARIEEIYADYPFPDRLPPYAALIVDAEDLLWAQDYPRAGGLTVRWTVLSAEGKLVAHAELPPHLDVLEIGTDYILGRYVHPVEAIPQVRMYSLRRN